MAHPIENIMRTTMENIKEMIDVNTVIGDAVETGEGVMIIPISKVSFAFLAGGGEYGEKSPITTQEEKMPFAGGTGAGVTVQPMGFLVVGNDQVRLLASNYNSPVDRIIEQVPSLMCELQSLIKKKNKAKDYETDCCMDDCGCGEPASQNPS